MEDIRFIDLLELLGKVNGNLEAIFADEGPEQLRQLVVESRNGVFRLIGIYPKGRNIEKESSSLIAVMMKLKEFELITDKALKKRLKKVKTPADIERGFADFVKKYWKSGFSFFK